MSLFLLSIRFTASALAFSTSTTVPTSLPSSVHLPEVRTGFSFHLPVQTPPARVALCAAQLPPRFSPYKEKLFLSAHVFRLQLIGSIALGSVPKEGKGRGEPHGSLEAKRETGGQGPRCPLESMSPMILLPSPALHLSRVPHLPTVLQTSHQADDTSPLRRNVSTKL